MLAASLVIASFVIFGALYLAPGNPITALSGGRALPPASLHVLELRYHLNQPFLAQYWYWLDNALHGNLGISITLQQNVSSVVAARMWTTGGLVLYAALIMLFSVKLGWFPALGNGTDLWSNVRHFTLPAIALAVSSLAIVARVTRAAVREEADREHVQTAISRGIPPRQLIR